MTLRLELESSQLWDLLWQAGARPKTRRAVYDWIASEWSRIDAKWEGDAVWPIVWVLSFACEDEQRTKLETLFAGLSQNASSWIRERVQDALRCRDLKDYGTESTASYLRGLRRQNAR